MTKGAEMGLLEPVRKSVTVRCPVEHAFRVFTADLSTWWPLATHSTLDSKAVSCAIEPHVGGALFECDAEGRRCVWGEVRTWDPPHRVAFTWHPGRDATTAQSVEVTFRDAGTPGDARTEVVLVHRGWEALGAKAAEVRAGYDSGWETVFVSHYARACEASSKN